MLSHNGRCCIGINSDSAAVTEPELLVECLREGLREVLAFGKPQIQPQGESKDKPKGKAPLKKPITPGVPARVAGRKSPKSTRTVT